METELEPIEAGEGEESDTFQNIIAIMSAIVSLFANYGLTIREAQELFGDLVWASRSGQSKVWPKIQQLIYKTNTLTKPTLTLAIQKLSISTIATVGNTPLAWRSP